MTLTATSLRRSAVAALTVALALVCAAAASAQIISVMVPAERVTSHKRQTAIHGMFGASAWDFSGDASERQSAELLGATLTNPRHRGFIVAVDLARSLTPVLQLGAGGWYNRLARQAQEYPNGSPGLLIDEPFAYVADQAFFSAYGSLFFKHVGVQAGFVGLRNHRHVDFAVSQGSWEVENSTVADVDVFAVGRFGGRRWSATVGGGVYRYDSRPYSTLLPVPDSPPSVAPTAFANASLFVLPRVSVDVSMWYTARDGNYSRADLTGNPSQTRLTIGLGVGR
jgi:hypothetical protein